MLLLLLLLLPLPIAPPPPLLLLLGPAPEAGAAAAVARLCCSSLTLSLLLLARASLGSTFSTILTVAPVSTRVKWKSSLSGKEGQGLWCGRGSCYEWVIAKKEQKVMKWV